MKDLTPAQYTEARQLILEAQHHMMEALVALNRYTEITDDKRAQFDIVMPLSIMTNEDNGYAMNRPNMDEVLKDLDETFSYMGTAEEAEEPSLPQFGYEGRMLDAEEMYEIGAEEMKNANYAIGAGSTYDETFVGVFSYEIAPNTYGSSKASFTAKALDGKWNVSRHGGLNK